MNSALNNYSKAISRLGYFKNDTNYMKYYLVLICSFVISNAMAQQHLIARKSLQSALIDQTISKVEIQEITFPAGQTAKKSKSWWDHLPGGSKSLYQAVHSGRNIPCAYNIAWSIEIAAGK